MNATTSELPLRKGAIWLWPDGTYVPVVSGGDDSDPPDPPDPPEGDPPEPDKDGKLSKADVDRIAAKARRGGKQDGRKDLAKELGLESEDDLKKLVSEHKAAQDAEKSEVQKEREQLATDRQSAAEESARAKKEKFEARCERALLRAGCSDKIVEKAIKLLEIDGTDDVELEDIMEAAKQLKEEMPQLFVASSEDDDGNPDSDPGKPPKPKGGTKSSEEQAKEIFARRHPKVTTGSQGGS